jgi:hypothetical protein
MSARPFQCTPANWNRDPVLNSVSWEAEFLFRRISLECDRYWRMTVDGENVAHSVRCRALEPLVRYRAWQENKVARLLDELRAAGIVILLCQGGRAWLQVANWLQYAKGSAPEIVPERAEQEEMALPGPELFVVPMRRIRDGPKRAGSTDAGYSAHCNERTSREEKDKTSTRPACGIEKELLGALAEILPPSEMLLNGGMWRERIRNCAKAVAMAVEDYKLRTPDQKRTIKNLPAWLTDRHERALAELEAARSASSR